MKDTTGFLRKLEAIKFVPERAYLASLDIKSFYTCMSNAKRIKVLEESCDKHTSKINM